ncbi:MAG: hypothetical protein CGU28_09955 [Candidatus Dactylopiibacterium carminicum]|uniref:Uncharacterized protein n=1 Tax=Candidatus Dactylopiibacterium carminicum TaxID=857335 RepID=A0A272ERC0_9RHOO|nr:hypothetical protein BGI27_11610 [Candidatus Dactylopiibacterium carminicum]PAS92624.1 MAG: hypothetical protein CGU29_10695 [Candidatus Dactylopiibacterium carminicum]PAS96114.1 MAG: hypothetical protein CGU28_09955 [Candidatus Dactylopiibacterium carminicum]PAS98732.1 MAG: hypothetical protein BSR46_11625 [Candidatus Dactylopiibacterium carminicum]
MLAQAVAQPLGLDADDLGGVQLSVRSAIRHGPFAGGWRLLGGRADSDLSLDGSLQEVSRTLLGGAPLMRARMSLELFGGVDGELSSPPLSSRFVRADGEPGHHGRGVIAQGNRAVSPVGAGTGAVVQPGREQASDDDGAAHAGPGGTLAARGFGDPAGRSAYRAGHFEPVG